MPHYLELITLACAWLGYGFAHSLLASIRCKTWFHARWPQLMYAYRAAFNLLAMILLIPILVYEKTINGISLWAWSGSSKTMMFLLMGCALGGFIWSLRYYNMRYFIGIQQWRNRHDETDSDMFTISPFHRFVRHPWYSLALLVLWTRDIESTTLVSNLVISGYFIIGAALEEKKLVTQFGDRYRNYQSQVPVLIPLPWRFLKADAARRLIEPGNQ